MFLKGSSGKTLPVPLASIERKLYPLATQAKVYYIWLELSPLYWSETLEFNSEHV